VHTKLQINLYMYSEDCSRDVTSKLKDWINFGIYWKNLLSHCRSLPWPWVCGLDTSGFVNSLDCRGNVLKHAILGTSKSNWKYLVFKAGNV